MTFDWWTFALQAVNFVILVWLLKRFLFKPVAAIVARRKEEISHALAAAQAAEQNAEQARRELEARRAQIEAARRAMVEEERARLAEEGKKMLEAARAEGEQLKQTMLKRLEEERAAITNEVFEQAAELAVVLATRLLQEVAASSLEQVFLQRVLEHLDRLSEAERAALYSAGNTQPLLIATAHTLSADEQQQWRSSLAKRLGNSPSFAFTTEPDLIAGAELRFPNATLRFNWRDSIAVARREMVSHERTS